MTFTKSTTIYVPTIEWQKKRIKYIQCIHMIHVWAQHWNIPIVFELEFYALCSDFRHCTCYKKKEFSWKRFLCSIRVSSDIGQQYVYIFVQDERSSSSSSCQINGLEYSRFSRNCRDASEPFFMRDWFCPIACSIKSLGLCKTYVHCTYKAFLFCWPSFDSHHKKVIKKEEKRNEFGWWKRKKA